MCHRQNEAGRNYNEILQKPRERGGQQSVMCCDPSVFLKCGIQLLMPTARSSDGSLPRGQLYAGRHCLLKKGGKEVMSAKKLHDERTTITGEEVDAAIVEHKKTGKQVQEIKNMKRRR
jgi:hypothetical protein